MCIGSQKAMGQWWIHCWEIKITQRCRGGRAGEVFGQGSRQGGAASSGSGSPCASSTFAFSCQGAGSCHRAVYTQSVLALNYAWPIYHAPSWKTNCVPGIYLLEIVVCCAGVPGVSGRANDWEVGACSEQDSWLHWSPHALDRFFTSIAFPRVFPLLPIFLHCITLNRAAGVLPVVSSIKKHTMCLKKGSLFRKCQPGWGEGASFFCVWFYSSFFYKHSVASYNVSNYCEHPLPLQV